MRRFVPALAGLVCAVAAWAAPAAAYEIDPLTRQPLDQPLSVTVRSAAPAAAAATTATDPLDASVPKLSPIPRETVAYSSPYSAGTIVVSTSERRLYYVLGNGQALRYGVGVGRPGFTWSGMKTVSAKREWPSWTPPKEMLARRPDLPRYMAGGIDNPLGARAMYIGGTLYRIHGSNEPDTIGQAVSSGCIRMTNDDVTDLYSRVKVGAKVVVLN